jgi:hypothetical protein
MWTSRKQTSGPPGLEQLHGFATVPRLRDDLELRPDLRELAGEGLAQQRLVVGDQGRRARAHHCPASRAGKSSTAETPLGCCAATRSSASPPNVSSKPLTQRREPGAQPAVRGLQPRARVAHAYDAPCTAALHVDVDDPALLAGIDAVAHRVLDQRQQRHGRTPQRPRRIVDVQREPEAIGHAHVHELE